MKCPNCGFDNQAGEEFCENCGFALNAANSPPTIVTGSNTVTTVSGPTTGNTATTISSGATSGTLTTNSRLQNGRYVVEKILGQGGMGAAVLAKDTRVSNKRVVIKELVSDNSDPKQRQEDVRNFEREVETLANLDHPLIPTVTDSFQEGTHYFMVQEYAPGENLEDHMARLKQPMPEEEALVYISQVLDILDYLSQQTPPVIHRDIKPANIIISSRDHRARLVDFGIARADVAKNAQRKQTSALGTPGYAPPEQYQGNADARSDLYALAATMHHLVTNRDPRDYPPFTYPHARSVNPKVSPETDRVLQKALEINVNNRYQSAAEMKSEIDAILAQRFHRGADTSVYLHGTSGPMTPIPPTIAASPAPARGVAPQRATPPPPPPPQPIRSQPQPIGRGQQQIGRQVPPQRQQNPIRSSFIILLVVVVLIAAVLLVPNLIKSNQQGGTQSGQGNTFPTAAATGTTAAPTGNGIGVTTINNEAIGISDGTVAFDTNRADGSEKQQAAESLKSGNIGSAQSAWRAALLKESNDAEAAIYLENSVVGNQPHITIVVATMLSGGSDLLSVGRDNLQGAYVAQREFNDKAKASGGPMVKLLIANTGGSADNATTVAKQIAQAAKNDNTIVGVSGWPYSSRATNAVPVLQQAQIPSVSSTASSDDLSGASPYFFRVAPTDTMQSGAGAKYAEQTLQARNVVVFEDTGDAYSRSLAEGFKKQFTGKVLATVNYTEGNRQSVTAALQQAKSQSTTPDLYYFAGYPKDVSVILEDTSTTNIKVLGGDALYNLGGYTKAARVGWNRLSFTGFAYPDEWDVLKLSAQKPAFYTDYGKAFDPSNQHPNAYGYSRAAYNVTLSYDATLVLLTAGNNIFASNGNKVFTPADLQKALTNIKGAQAVQGASGQISFDTSGNPANKAVVVQYVDNGYIKMQPVLGAGTLTK
jgi:serine/threonine protein kinase/ABC-type branched-subunit amino acid transport system substrate-binding protein